MESNLFIKSYKAQGKKITDIEFYGDWEINVGSSGGPVEVEYETIDMLKSGLLPYGVTMTRRQGSTSAQTVFSFENASDVRYIIRASMENKGSSYYLDPNTTTEIEVSTINNDWTFVITTDDLKTIVGYIFTR